MTHFITKYWRRAEGDRAQVDRGDRSRHRREFRCGLHMEKRTTTRTGEHQSESKCSLNTPGKARLRITCHRISLGFAHHHRANLAPRAIGCQSAPGFALLRTAAEWGGSALLDN